MKYYKSNTGEVFAYDSEQVAAGLAVEKNELTVAEVQEHLSPTVPADTRRARQLTAIDTAAGAARLRYVSAGRLIEEEYRQALHAVQVWRAAGSPADDVPPEIDSGAEYSDITVEAAAVEIEETAAHWEGVLSAIRELRLGGKAAVKAATDAEIEAVAAGYIEQLEAMKPIV